MAAAGIFGALSALGGAGNQMAEGNQLAHEEIVRRLAEGQAQQLTNQKIAKGAQDLAASKQPVALGQAYVSGGKTYQRYQDPITGAVTNKELPGGLPETDPEKFFRGLRAFLPEDQAAQATVQHFHGRAVTTKREVTADPTSPTGFSAVYLDSQTGEEVFRHETVAPRTATGTETTRKSIDQYGNVTETDTIRKPLLAAPTGGQGAPRGTVAAPVASGGQGVPKAGQGAAFLQALANANVPAAPAAAPAPARRATPKAGSPAPAGGQGTLAVGTYKGLDPNTQAIPENARMNPQIREFANDILAGRDVSKIPTKARALAESIARQYGWKGQGSLTPAQQMQIEQVDNSLAALSKMTGIFDSGLGRLAMSTVPLDPTGEGGTGGLSASLMRGMMSDQQTQYMNALTRLRGVITGIRGFTGANNSNATADRLLAELPNFTNTKNAKDAKDKLDKLRQEVQIIKRLGYFLPDSDPRIAGSSAAAPAATADDPLGLFAGTGGR